MPFSTQKKYMIKRYKNLAYLPQENLIFIYLDTNLMENLDYQYSFT
jgi:hypothetical protein